MRRWSRASERIKALLASAVLGVAATAASAQAPQYQVTQYQVPRYVVPPGQNCVPCPCPTAPGTPVMPWTAPTTPPTTTTPPQPGTVPTTPSETAPSTPTSSGASAEMFGSLARGSDIGAGVAVARDGGAYLDSAIPRTQIRLRFDAAYDDNRPDRAEFFYPKCGCFMTPDARGPALPEKSVDYQDIRTYIEAAYDNRFSAFLEVPVRFLNPEVNPNTNGLGDINFGAKYAVIANCDQYATVQLRTFTPTGDPFKGLGTNHWTLEPSLLYYSALSDRLSFQAELSDYIPLGGSDFAGNVLQYGAGLTYAAYRGPSFRVSPVVELVGWTVLSGKEANDAGQAVSASGDTIVNAKFGLRFGLGDVTQPGLLNQSDFYIGYGRALTGEVWYKDIVRAELRLRF